MNPLLSALRSFLIGGALIASAHAQLVHLTATQQLDGGSGLLFRANDATIPWNHSGGFISRLDLYYDVNDAIGSDGIYTFSNPSRNVWRIRVHAYELGDFEITRPLQSMAVSEASEFFEASMTFEFFDPDTYEEFDLIFRFATPLADRSPPVPPLEISSASYYLQAGRYFFDVPNLTEGYGAAIFETASARIASSVDLTPVPEPSTYALGAVALLGLALWRRRRHASA